MFNIRKSIQLIVFFSCVFCYSGLCQNDGTINKQQKISNIEGNFNHQLQAGESFGSGATGIGDLNGDGIEDMIVCAPGEQRIYVLFLKKDGSVKSFQIIGENKGGWNISFGLRTDFGEDVANIGDLNQDGNNDILVGEQRADYGGRLKGGAWLLFLNANGRIKDYRQISDTSAGFRNQLQQEDAFGSSCSSIGDLNEDGIDEFAIGAYSRGGQKGAIWIFFPTKSGKINKFKKISYADLPINNSNRTSFGSSITNVGDINSDNIPDIVVGADGDDDGGQFKGAVWNIFLNEDGSMKNYQKISETSGNLNDTFSQEANFGASLTALRDLNGDTIPDIAVGAPDEKYGDTLTEKGKVRVLFLDKNGMVKRQQAIGNELGNFNDTLKGGDFFGSSLANIGDLNGDTIPELAVGASGDSEGAIGTGAAYILFLNGVPQMPDDDDQDSTSGLEPNKPFKRLNTYPNPVAQSQNLTLGLPSGLPEGQQGKVVLFDMEGQLVKRKDFTSRGQQEIQLALPGLSSGSYQLYLKAGNFQGFSKVVVGGR